MASRPVTFGTSVRLRAAAVVLSLLTLLTAAGPTATARAQATATDPGTTSTEGSVTVDPSAPAVAPTLPESGLDPLVTASPDELVARPVPGPQPEAPGLTASGAVLFDPADQVVLTGVDPQVPRRMASTTKIMTLLLALEALADGSVAPELTVSPFAEEVDHAPGGASLDLEAGDVVPVEDLLAALLLRSGNGGAVALAEHIAGNETAFVSMMNARAVEMGLDDTTFVNSSGLTDDEDHHATPLDLALLGIEAMRYPSFAEWAGAATYDTGFFGVEENRNEMLTAYDGTIGIKTGFTTLAGQCLVAAAERDGRILYAVVLGSENRVADTSALFDHGFEDYARPTPLVAGDTPSSYRWAAGEVPLQVAEDLARTVGSGATVETVTRLAPDAGLPVEAGTPLGEVVLVVDGEEVDRTPLLAAAAVQAPTDTAGAAVADTIRAFARLAEQREAVAA